MANPNLEVIRKHIEWLCGPYALMGEITIINGERWTEDGNGKKIRLLDVAPELEREAMKNGVVERDAARRRVAVEIEKAIARIEELEQEVESLGYQLMEQGELYEMGSD